MSNRVLLYIYILLVFFTNLSLIEFQVRYIFDRISSFSVMVLDEKSSQEHPFNAGVQCSILAPTLYLIYINDLPDDAVCNIAIYADDTTLNSKCDQVSYL